MPFLQRDWSVSATPGESDCAVRRKPGQSGALFSVHVDVAGKRQPIKLKNESYLSFTGGVQSPFGARSAN
jgi:hypothetical protein